jgi:murein DD-endopeptidase MepM/ murein hydrolase activator NlpD
MSIPRTPFIRAACVWLAAVAGCAAISMLPDRPGTARAAGTDQLKRQIGAGQDRISSLSGAVRSSSSRLGELHSSISGLMQRIARIQADLNADRKQMLQLRDRLAAARTRLAQLEAYEAHAESVLAKQLVAGYETDPPDIVTVVLEAHGFQDLLEQLSFEQRIRKQNVEVVSHVKAGRRAVAAQAVHLGGLEAYRQRLTAAVLGERDRLSATRVNLVEQEISVARFRSHKASELASVRGQVSALRSRLARIEAAQAAAAAAAAARARKAAVASAPASAPGPSSAPSSPVRVTSGGGFTFPLPISAAAPPSAWSHDQGVDISAPGGTPEFAVCSGTIVLHGIGGFGPWAPVLHCDSPLDAYSYVYYGHAGPADQLPVGTHVGAGQVMSEVGPGIVGISSGPHLEIGFADASGSLIGAGSASTMLALLRGAY